MLFRRGLAGAAGLALLAACDPYPPFEHEGERVVLATDFGPRVCAGTLARMDAELEYVEAQLELPESHERLRVAVVDGETAVELCGVSSACASHEGGAQTAVLTPGNWELALRHELVHASVARHQEPGSIAFFREALAEAIEPARCPPKLSSPDPERLLLASADELGISGRFVAGQLFAWLLELHGPALVLDFVASLQRAELLESSTPPDRARASYRRHFGSEFDEDLGAHERDLDALTTEAFGCMGPRVSAEEGRLHLATEFSCSSPRVQNDFRTPSVVFVTWQLEVPTTQRYVLATSPPAGTRLAIKACSCGFARADPRVSWTEDSLEGAYVELGPGSYALRFSGPVGGGVEQEVELLVEDAS